jgi:uncharacterized protein (UPF0332 family)
MMSQPEQHDYLEKAERNFEMAKELRMDNPNAAANRLYYALYQLMVLNAEHDCIQYQSFIDRNGRHYNFWRHELLCDHCEVILAALLNNGIRNCRSVSDRAKCFKKCFENRVTADYKPKSVGEQEIDWGPAEELYVTLVTHFMGG